MPVDACSRPAHDTVNEALPRNAMGKAAEWFAPFN